MTRLLKKPLLFYSLTTIVFITYFYFTTGDCKAYYIHDDAIDISARRMIELSLQLFMPTIILLGIAGILKIENSLTLIYVHYFTALIALLSLAIAIAKPCENTNGGNYMFVDFITIALSYLLRLTSYVLTAVILIRLSLNVLKKRTDNA